MYSAGLIPYRMSDDGLQILIAHPGGPFWARKELGAWSIVKGEIDPGENPLDSARREFTEETGWDTPESGFLSLGEVTQKAGKRITAWAFAGDFDPDKLVPEMVTIRVRGNEMRIPEIDQVRWCGEDEAVSLLNPAQTVYYERLKSVLTGLREDD